MTQQYMTSGHLDYTWEVNGVEVKETIFEGVSANYTANNVGNAARSIAKLPLGPGKDYKFAIYLLCDYAWDIILTSNLNVFIAGNYYNNTGYAVSFQYFSFNSKQGQVWGKSQWMNLNGLIMNSYQMQEYNGNFRVVLTNTNADGNISVVKVPLSTFNPSDGATYPNLGVQDQSFIASRWRKDLVFLTFYPNTTRVFSTAYEATTQTLVTE